MDGSVCYMNDGKLPSRRHLQHSTIRYINLRMRIETTSSSRIFIKILVQEMAECMGMVTVKQQFDTDNPEPDGAISERMLMNMD